VFGAGLGAAVVLHTSFGDAGPVMDRMRELPVDAVGVDLVETDVESLGAGWTGGLVLGCVNGRSSLVESVDVTVKVAKAAADQAQPSALYLSSGTSFDLLPYAVAAAKVRVVGEATRLLREELG
jgi:methionine synthase II (cobalamin-independent)